MTPFPAEDHTYDYARELDAIRDSEPDDRPTRADFAGERDPAPPRPWRGETPDHLPGWGCCSAPFTAHPSAADLDQADRNREAGL